MPLALLLIGVVILVTAFHGTTGELAGLLKEDIAGHDGQKGFVRWLLAFAIIGGFSYIPGFRPVANAFFALVIIAMILTHGGFFDQLAAALNGAGSGKTSHELTSHGQGQ